jgi:hypothetical protein
MLRLSQSMNGRISPVCVRAARALALLGMFAFATVLPWYAAARHAAFSAEARLAADLGLICHGSVGAGTDGATHEKSPASPARPCLDCPICQGLSSAAKFAILSAGALLPPAPTVAARHRVADNAVRPGTEVLALRNRGPPIPA